MWGLCDGITRKGPGQSAPANSWDSVPDWEQHNTIPEGDSQLGTATEQYCIEGHGETGITARIIGSTSGSRRQTLLAHSSKPWSPT